MDQALIMEWLSQPLGPLTAGQWLGGAFGLGTLMWLGSQIGRSRGSHGDKLSQARCLVCKWEGNVSKYHRICPKCRNQITRLARNER